MEPWAIVSIIAAVVAALTGISYPIIKSLTKRWRSKKKYYGTIWKKSSKLTSEEVMDIRGKPEFGFNKIYQRRDVDKLIEQRIEEGKNTLVIGNPLAGKSRAFYYVMTTLLKRAHVLIPRVIDVATDDFVVPRCLRFRTIRIVLLDDIDKFAAKQNFDYTLQEFRKKGFIILATCRSGPEYEQLRKKMEKELPIFGDPIEIAKISPKTAQDVAERAARKLPDRFDGNIGSIFVPLVAMKERYDDCSDDEKGALVSIKRLYSAGIYEGREVFGEDRIRLICDKCEGIRKEQNEWRGIFDRLATTGFIGKKNKDIRIEETYLQDIIETDLDILENFGQLANHFAGNPDALFKLGFKAYNIGLVDLQIAEYMKIAIDAYENTLGVWTYKTHPKDCPMTQNNLGTAYRKLAEVSDKAGNCWKAIESYVEALKVYTYKAFPMDYAMTQNNLGTAYDTLAEVSDKADNCRKAIQSFEEALKVRTRKAFPKDYAMTQNNLGIAYGNLAEVTDKAENCGKAIQSYKEALKVYTYKAFPKDYAMTQSNLGTAYRKLAEVSDKAENCGKAIRSYEEALKVRTLEAFPIQYAMTQNNLGVAYSTLAEVTDKADNCRKAIQSLEEALKVYTYEAFPIGYAMTQYNLGAAHGKLSQVDNKPENCMKARRALEEALRVCKQQGLVQRQKDTEHSLKWLSGICGEDME